MAKKDPLYLLPIFENQKIWKAHGESKGSENSQAKILV